MCGIAGTFGNRSQYTKDIITNMIYLLECRGSDSRGVYSDERVTLAHTRLAIRGIKEGQQPVFNAKENIISITNGEIYNFQELLVKLNSHGYHLATSCDTNIIPYLYEAFGVKMFEMINGQFAIAIWDKRNSKLVLARDRFGQKPLYYRNVNGEIYFSSEINPLLEINKNFKINAKCLIDICTTWAQFDKKTIYTDVFSVNCGEYISISDVGIKKVKYYYPEFKQSINKYVTKSEAVEQLNVLLKKSIARHKIAEVPMACYLSGGLDSSIIAALASDYGREKLETFSISFDKNGIDEAYYQNIIVNRFNTNHHNLSISENDIIENFYNCIKHIQMPILRLGVIPMYLLSKYVHDCGFKVVLTGEGADELFGGYDIFKEVKIRKFCEREPTVQNRAILYRQTNSFVDGFGQENVAALAAFFNQIKSDVPLSSHLLRFQFGNYCKQFFSYELKKTLNNYSVINELKNILPNTYNEFTDISKAQYIEIVTFMENYLLSSQGDRISMAHSVECRYPFLDNDIVKFALHLEDKYKIRGLNEKYILKEVAKEYLPVEIINRKKFPYRAVINHNKFIRNDKILWILSKEQLCKTNIFDWQAVTKFLNKIIYKDRITEKELMLLLFISSTQTIFST